MSNRRLSGYICKVATFHIFLKKQKLNAAINYYNNYLAIVQHCGRGTDPEDRISNSTITLIRGTNPCCCTDCIETLSDTHVNNPSSFLAACLLIPTFQVDASLHPNLHLADNLTLHTLACSQDLHFGC